jgi:acyl transferase domain-containing protein
LFDVVTRILAYTFCRHFLEHVNLAEIDSSFWSMTRKEIEVMDPQQRLALEVVYECLQSSGTTNWKGKDIGVFFGIYGEVMAHQYPVL